MRAAGETALSAAGLRPRHLLAMTVLRDQGESSQADLAGTLQLDRTNLVGLLNELETDGPDRAPPLARGPAPPHGRADRRRAASASPAPSSRSPPPRTSCSRALTAKQRDTLYELLRKATAADC